MIQVLELNILFATFSKSSYSGILVIINSNVYSVYNCDITGFGSSI